VFLSGAFRNDIAWTEKLMASRQPRLSCSVLGECKLGVGNMTRGRERHGDASATVMEALRSGRRRLFPDPRPPVLAGIIQLSR
jgi:hypothetical protein